MIYLAVWAASAVLIVMGGGRRRAGLLLGLGTSIVTFGFFLSDVGTVIASGAHLMGPGLVLGVAGWLACTAGCAALFRPRPGELPRRRSPPPHRSQPTLTASRPWYPRRRGPLPTVLIRSPYGRRAWRP